MSFAENLTRCRKKAGLTVTELAKASGVPFQLLYGYESGKYRDVTIKTVEKIAAALGVKPGDLIAGDK